MSIKFLAKSTFHLSKILNQWEFFFLNEAVVTSYRTQSRREYYSLSIEWLSLVKHLEKNFSHRECGLFNELIYYGWRFTRCLCVSFSFIYIHTHINIFIETHKKVESTQQNYSEVLWGRCFLRLQDKKRGLSIIKPQYPCLIALSLDRTVSMTMKGFEPLQFRKSHEHRRDVNDESVREMIQKQSSSNHIKKLTKLFRFFMQTHGAN